MLPLFFLAGKQFVKDKYMSLNSESALSFVSTQFSHFGLLAYRQTARFVRSQSVTNLAVSALVEYTKHFRYEDYGLHKDGLSTVKLKSNKI
jgi:hypothetical protein